MRARRVSHLRCRVERVSFAGSPFGLIVNDMALTIAEFRPAPGIAAIVRWGNPFNDDPLHLECSSDLGREDFRVDPRVLRRGLMENGYRELAVTGAHATAVDLLPAVHKDPFDRMLVAQAQIKGMPLLTSDSVVARYPGPIELI